MCVLLIFEQVGYPSGQRMRTVNPSSYAVRGFDPHPHHSKDETARTRRFFLSLETRPAPKNCHLFAKLQTFICRRAHLPGTNASLLKNIPCQEFCYRLLATDFFCLLMQSSERRPCKIFCTTKMRQPICDKAMRSPQMMLRARLPTETPRGLRHYL